MDDKFEQTSATTRVFTLDFLEKITNNFSEEHIIGSGGYGVVYKGVLDNGEEIALKKLHHMPGLDDTQFRNEFNNLMRAQHPNITRLVGYCYNTGHERIKYGDEYIFALVEERVLCFEYLRGGSLDKHITDESCGLDWQTRFNIIKGICEGLKYLHTGSKDPIYHLDLKPANILLDENMVPKIGDLGLSRLFPSENTYITGKIIGTPGYMPPEYIERHEITAKFDVFSLGVILIRIIAGEEGYSKCAHMSPQEFLEHVHENWGKRLLTTMSFQTSKQIKTCIEIALRCVELNRQKRPTIAEIVDELNKVIKKQNWNSERKGRIVLSATNRPALPYDIFSFSFPPSFTDSELHLTDGVSHNYNGRAIPPAVLMTLLKSPKLTYVGGVTDADLNTGHVSGLVFVSEREDGLETLCIALYFNATGKVKVFTLADIFGSTDFSGTRLEDSGCFGGGYSIGSRNVGHYLIYVSTKEPVHDSRSPWTVVYKTHLTTGKTERLTPEGVFDLSPAVSPSGKTVAVASFQSKSWNGAIENLKTDIYVMNVGSEEGLGRKLLIKNGGWPSWGSDNIIFFHRGTEKTLPTSMVETVWGVYRYNISTKHTVQVTPEEFDAMTPAAINETKVAVATIRKKKSLVEVQYRHIEIFDMSAPGLQPVHITQKMRPDCDHYNPFVQDGGCRIGYHRCRSDVLQHRDHMPQNLHRVESPAKDIGLFQVSGLSPTISKDGSKLAFVDKERETVFLADSKGMRIVQKPYTSKRSYVFSPAWNQNPNMDILFICIGLSFNAQELEIYAIINVSGNAAQRKFKRLTHGGFNHAFPSSSPGGNRLVFQSTSGFSSRKNNSPPIMELVSEGNSQTTRRSWLNKFWQGHPSKKKQSGGESSSQVTMDGNKKYQLSGEGSSQATMYRKNLYIMTDPYGDGIREGVVTRLTDGDWIDTQCQWSPNGDWIVFTSTRDTAASVFDEDRAYFSVYLVKVRDPTVVIRVMDSGGDFGSNINHPVFSPNGRSIAVTVDLAGVVVEPVSLPRFKHVVQPCGDIFVINTDPDDNWNNKKDVKGWIRRITYSRYGCGTLAWTKTLFGSTDPNSPWNMLLKIEPERDRQNRLY